MPESSYKIPLSSRSSANAQNSLVSASIAATAAVSIVLNPTTATAETKKADTPDKSNPLPDPNILNKRIQKNYPPELLKEAGIETPAEWTEGGKNGQQQHLSPTVTKDATVVKSGNNISIVIPTPALVAMFVLVGALAAFPIVHIFWKSRELKANTWWDKLTAKWRKPPVLESDRFLHKRDLDKLIALSQKAEAIDAEKFSNEEFKIFFKIKSFISRSLGEYANLDEIIEMLNAAIITQNSFLSIEQTESRYCSAIQQKLYHHVQNLLNEGVTPEVLNQEIKDKLEQLSPQLKTEEGRLALQSYASEMGKVTAHPLGIKLLTLFKAYHFDDYSTIRTVASAINRLDSVNLLDIDGIMMLVIEQFDAFEKIGPIVGVTPEYNRPETYSKILQYIGLKSAHEASYAQFQELLSLLSKWEIHARSIREIRHKYKAGEYEIPKEFTMELPSTELYEKFKDRVESASANNLSANSNLIGNNSAVKEPVAVASR
jgi:hypothetical protein